MAPPPPFPDEPELDVVVETPTSPSSGLALCRFEFETGRGNEGTKILMVEWDAAAAAAGGANGAGGSGGAAAPADDPEDGEWEVSWEGKTAVLPVGESDLVGGTTRRVYFLLPPGAPIPTLVTIAKKPSHPTPENGGGGGGGGGGAPLKLQTKPLPAIFPPALAGEEAARSAAAAGTRGVLHTLWARRRLGELEAEMAAEMRANSESIGLEMAAQEHQWIVDHFGLAADTSSAGALLPLGARAAGAGDGGEAGPGAAPTAGPRSPVPGRLGEKLRGLKLATSPAELAAATEASKTAPRPPQRAPGDVAVSSSLAASRGRPGAPAPAAGGVASLDAVIGGAGAGAGGNPDGEEDLFALPMSPRSPEMARSPFSLLG